MIKGYIDLSKRRVSAEDIVKCEERYNKSKMVHSILRHVAEKTQTPIEELYERIGWPLNKKYGHAVDAFKLSITYFCPFFCQWHLSNWSIATKMSGQTSRSPTKLWRKN